MIIIQTIYDFNISLYSMLCVYDKQTNKKKRNSSISKLKLSKIDQMKATKDL